MRDYQRKKNNPYRLPHNVYKQVLYMVMDYDRLREERADILSAAQSSAELISSDPTQSAAMRLERISWRLDGIERAADKIPKEYRRGVLNNILYGSPYPMDADPSTYARWRQRFIYWTAIKLSLL